jgi:hypothetical protein
MGLGLDTFHFFDDFLVIGVTQEVSGDLWCILRAHHVLYLAILLLFPLIFIPCVIINLCKRYFDPLV